MCSLGYYPVFFFCLSSLWEKSLALRRRTKLPTRPFIYRIWVSGKLSLYLYLSKRKEVMALKFVRFHNNLNNKNMADNPRDYLPPELLYLNRQLLKLTLEVVAAHQTMLIPAWNPICLNTQVSSVYYPKSLNQVFLCIKLYDNIPNL